jgi:PAS domain S-box-containing protein
MVPRRRAADPGGADAPAGAAIAEARRDECLSRLVKLAADVLHAPVALIAIAGESMRMPWSVGVPQMARDGAPTTLGGSVIERVVRGHPAVVVRDARHDPSVRDDPAIESLGLVACLAVPLIDAAGAALGALTVIDHEPRGWSNEEVETVETLAAAARAELELDRVRHERFQQLVDHAPAIVSVKGLDGRYLLVNRMFEDVFGIRRDRALGRTDDDLFPPRLARDYMAHDRQVTESGSPLEIEETAALDDGLHHYVSLKFPLRDPGGRIDAIAGISYDTTQRRAAQRERDEALERERQAVTAADQSRRVLADILERVTDGFVAFDRRWRYTYVNERAGELLGRSPDELVGRNYQEEFPEAVGTPFEQAYQRAMRDQVPITLDEHYEPWDRWFENRIYPSPGGLSVFFSEITERKRVEREHRDLHERLERHSVELEERVLERTRDLEAANRELEAFSYTVSHDLRAPLRSMEGFARALLDDYGATLEGDGLEYAGRIAAAAGRMSELIDDLLAYARLSRVELHLSRIPLASVVADARGQIGAELEGRGAVVMVQEPLPVVVGHRRTLVQVVANLLSNAAKFVDGTAPPSIVVRAEPRGTGVRLWVEDNGIGIAPEHQERIFQVFERLHGSESYPGTGIGLAIVRKGAERMGGHAGLESSPGSGSRFWVDLPAAAPAPGKARHRSKPDGDPRPDDPNR